MARPLLQVDGLTKRFGALAAVDGIALKLAPGERLGLIGPNGAGKSTLFALLSGALFPDSGRILLSGEEVSTLDPASRARRGLSRSFQRSALFEPMSVAENLALADIAARGEAWRVFPGKRPGDRARVEKAAAAAGLGAHLARPVSDLSYGDKRRLEIAIALMGEPKLLLLDEPTAGMGAEETAETQARIAALPRDLGIILVEHDLDVVFTLASRVLVMAEGRVVFDGPPIDAATDPSVRRVYLGDGHAAG